VSPCATACAGRPTTNTKTHDGPEKEPKGRRAPGHEGICTCSRCMAASIGVHRPCRFHAPLPFTVHGAHGGVHCLAFTPTPSLCAHTRRCSSPCARSPPAVHALAIHSRPGCVPIALHSHPAVHGPEASSPCVRAASGKGRPVRLLFTPGPIPTCHSHRGHSHTAVHGPEASIALRTRRQWESVSSVYPFGACRPLKMRSSAACHSGES